MSFDRVFTLHWLLISIMYHIVVQIPTHSIINIDMVDSLTQTWVVTLLFPSLETLFAETSLSHFVELMSTENMPVRGIASLLDATENRSFPSLTVWCRISTTLYGKTQFCKLLFDWTIYLKKDETTITRRRKSD